MKLSADRKSAHWHPVALHAKVFLDGAELTMCLEADEDAGSVVHCVLDRAGRLVQDPMTHEPMTEILRGQVRIEVPEDRRHLLADFPFGPCEEIACATEFAQ